MKTERRSSPLLRMAAVTGAFAMIVIAVYFGMRPDAAPPAALPVPNGYDLFVEALPELTGEAGDYRQMDAEALRALVENHSTALALVRKGLQQECRVPVQYSMEWSSANTSTFGQMKRLALTLAAEGRLAELDGRHRDAAQSYLDVIRLGAESARGGVLINALIGIAIEAIGTRHLKELMTRLDTSPSREVLDTLERFDAQRESWEDVLRREREWVRRSYPFYMRAAGLLKSRTLKPAQQKAETAYHRQQHSVRSLMMDLAAQAFELETGNPPADARDLVPAYLKSIPKHPASGVDLASPLWE